jgi:hypothetical protein
MIKFGRPDLMAGVTAERIDETGRILNHLARMLAEGHVLAPGQQLRFDGAPTLTVADYNPVASIPNPNLNNDAQLLIHS